MSHAEQSTITASPPDWNAIESDVFCPLCDYNLRGLTDPRCPECGFGFEWPDVLDPSRRIHPYIFEHHPERNFRSFWRTAFAGWRPRRFWTSLHPAQPSRPRRLMLYWGVAAGMVVLAYLITFAALTHDGATQQAAFKVRLIAYMNTPAAAQRRAVVVSEYGSVQAYADAVYPTRYVKNAQKILTSDGLFGAFVLPMACILSWSWMTLAALLIFRASMRRARIKTVQVLRCVIYCSADLLLWLAVLLLMLTPAHVLAMMGMRWWIGFMAVSATCCAVSCIALTTHRLTIAYRLYLRFDHPDATVLASQIVALLVMANAVVAAVVWTH